jgi:hypothetical protein
MSKNEVATKLTAADKKALAKHEETIRGGLASFIDVGRALAEIRDSTLYRDDFESFEDYCNTRWDLKRQTAYDKIHAAEIVAEIEHVRSSVHLPQAESHALALVKAKDKAPKVWAEVLKKSPKLADGSPCTTAKKIAAIRDELLKPKTEASENSTMTQSSPTSGEKAGGTESAASSDQSQAAVGKVESKPAAATSDSDNPFPEQSERMHKSSKQLSYLAGQIKSVAEEIATFQGDAFSAFVMRENVGIQLGNVVDSLQVHANNVKNAAPASMCLDCAGRGCIFCQQRRWQTFGERKEAEARRTAKNGKRPKAGAVA